MGDGAVGVNKWVSEGVCVCVCCATKPSGKSLQVQSGLVHPKPPSVGKETPEQHDGSARPLVAQRQWPRVFALGMALDPSFPQ